MKNLYVITLKKLKRQWQKPSLLITKKISMLLPSIDHHQRYQNRFNTIIKKMATFRFDTPQGPCNGQMITGGCLLLVFEPSVAMMQGTTLCSDASVSLTSENALLKNTALRPPSENALSPLRQVLNSFRNQPNRLSDAVIQERLWQQRYQSMHGVKAEKCDLCKEQQTWCACAKNEFMGGICPDIIVHYRVQEHKRLSREATNVCGLYAKHLHEYAASFL